MADQRTGASYHDVEVAKLEIAWAMTEKAMASAGMQQFVNEANYVERARATFVKACEAVAEGQQNI